MYSGNADENTAPRLNLDCKIPIRGEYLNSKSGNLDRKALESRNFLAVCVLIEEGYGDSGVGCGNHVEG